MSLKSRLRKLEQKLGRDDEVRRLLVVFAELDRRWTAGNGEEIDPASIDPRTQVIVFRTRPDGPQ
jgi:hypothetical protein